MVTYAADLTILFLEIWINMEMGWFDVSEQW